MLKIRWFLPPFQLVHRRKSTLHNKYGKTRLHEMGTWEQGHVVWDSGNETTWYEFLGMRLQGMRFSEWGYMVWDWEWDYMVWDSRNEATWYETLGMRLHSMRLGMRLHGMVLTYTGRLFNSVDVSIKSKLLWLSMSIEGINTHALDASRW